MYVVYIYTPGVYDVLRIINHLNNKTMKGFDFKISPREGYGRIGVIAEIPVETIWAAKRAMAALINDTKDTEHFESAVKVCSIMAKVMLISPIDVDAVTAENDEFASYFTKKNEPEN